YHIFCSCSSLARIQSENEREKQADASGSYEGSHLTIATSCFLRLCGCFSLRDSVQFGAAMGGGWSSHANGAFDPIRRESSHHALLHSTLSSSCQVDSIFSTLRERLK
ncbi:hypothetical protein PENTCL1PPCAC_9950, partial [Pristionchus entomophagus]